MHPFPYHDHYCEALQERLHWLCILFAAAGNVRTRPSSFLKVTLSALRLVSPVQRTAAEPAQKRRKYRNQWEDMA